MCQLHVYGKNLVSGCGDNKSDMMIIGHNPKFTDDRIGTPLAGLNELIESECGMCGNVNKCFSYWMHNIPGDYDPNICDLKALSQDIRQELLEKYKDSIDKQSSFNTGGQFLNRQLKEEGINRLNIYITYAVKCSTPGGRPPTIDEVKQCRELLNIEISEVNPKVILCLGDKASYAVLGRVVNASESSSVIEVEINGKKYKTLHSHCPEQLILNNQLRIKCKKENSPMLGHYSEIMNKISNDIKSKIKLAKEAML
jgi:uracil-DNA glycosylase family 4